jgi:Flp pilus assembly protein TadG
MQRLHIFRRAVRRRGAVAVLVALLLVVLLGITALVLDGGYARENVRRVQGACDAAALAAANQLFIHYPQIVTSHYWNYDPGGAAVTAGLANAATNGFPNDGNHSIVYVHVPPWTGPFAGRPGYASVGITYYQNRAFSRIWGAAAIPVRARAVARGRWSDSGKGIILLDPTSRASLNASGGGTIRVTGGAGVVVDSNHGEASVVTGGGSITAAGFEITGGYTGPLTGPVNTGVPPTPDPLSYLPQPSAPVTSGQMTTENLTQGNKRYILTPGRFTNLPNFNVGDEVILGQASVNANGGIYYLDGCGFKSTGANITMDPNSTGGVMLFNMPSSTAQSQQIQISGNSSGTVNLSGLTSGSYAGVLFWQDRTATQPLSVSGGGSFSLTGTFYAANATLQITGSGDAKIGSQYISRALNVGGGGNITIDYRSEDTARIREATLVE